MKAYKRVIADLILLLFLVVGLAEIGLSSNKPVATAWKACVPVVIDGMLNEWDISSPLILEREEQVIRDRNQWAGPADLSARVYVMWDETNLYIGAEVADDTPFAATPMLPIEDNDNITLYLSTDPNADPAREKYATTDFKVILVIDNLYFDTAIDRDMVEKPKGLWSAGLEGGKNVLKGYERAAALTPTGFTFEAKIPWANFANKDIPLFTPQGGQSIGFNVVITDIAYPCPGTEFIPQMAWTGDASISENPSGWGILVFDSKCKY